MKIPSSIHRRAIRSPIALIALSLCVLGVPAHAQSVCEDASIAFGAVVSQSTVGCSVDVAFDARIVQSSLLGRVSVGARSFLLAAAVRGEPANVLIGDNVQIVAATVSDSELGRGVILDPGARVELSVLSRRVRVERGARLVGGRNIDTLVVGADSTIGAGSRVQGRGLGAGSVIGRNALIGSDTEAGLDFRLGDGSVWDGPGLVGDGVTVRENVRIARGLNAGEGVNIGAGVEIGVAVRIGVFTSVYREARIENDVTIGRSVLIGRRATIGSGATIEDNVLARRDVTIGAGASVGANSILDVGASVPPGANVPARSFVDRDGGVSPL